MTIKIDCGKIKQYVNKVNIKDVLKMNSYYEQLMNFKGSEELCELVKRWEVLSDNISKRSTGAPIVLPDLFLYTRPGYGNTAILDLMAQYLSSKQNLMSFYGDVKFFEFKLEYCRPDSEFKELYRLIESAQKAAGFRSEYKGIVRINIDEWVGHHNEKHFLDFLTFLQINTAYWLIVLTVSTHKEGNETKEMEAVVSMYLRTERIKIDLPDNRGLVEYAEEYLDNYGFELDESAEKLLERSIEVLRKNKYFYGYHTIRDMCNDIVYSLFSKELVEDKVINAEMLSGFSADSEYIKRTVMKIKKTEYIGF